MTRRLFNTIAVTMLLAFAVTAFAHHSQSGEFDRNKPIEFTGTVKVVEWTNPHGYAQLETKSADGATVVYRAEFQAPNQLYRAGWRKDSLKIGTVIKFKGVRSRDPKSPNVSGSMTMPDGKVAFQGDGPHAIPSNQP